MQVHVFQHVPFEGLGSIATLLEQRQAGVGFTRFYEPAARLPALAEVDCLIVLGGPMSVNDEEELPWLRQEKRFISEAIADGKAVLGICLGAQLIASALGARVYPGPEKEIGWFPILAEPVGVGTFAFPASVQVFHWHGETFDLPAGAVRLAASAACRNQAFQLGDRVLGLQFHLETTPESAAAILTHCADELLGNHPYIQAASALRVVPVADYTGINRLMAELFAYLVRDIEADQPVDCLPPKTA